MNKISGIYAASLSVLNDDLTLNINKTIQHAEKINPEKVYKKVIEILN